MGSKDIIRLDDNQTDVPRPCQGTCKRAHLPHQSPRGRFEGEVDRD